MISRNRQGGAALSPERNWIVSFIRFVHFHYRPVLLEWCFVSGEW